jgi:hypothetical protein
MLLLFFLKLPFMFMTSQFTRISKMENVHFWPSNYMLSLALAIELQNWKSLTIQLSKLFKFGFWQLDGKKIPILEFDGQNQT